MKQPTQEQHKARLKLREQANDLGLYLEGVARDFNSMPMKRVQKIKRLMAHCDRLRAGQAKPKR